jgi:enoyl-CoA hydratase/carnithine racemase
MARITTERITYGRQGTAAVIEIGDGTRLNALGRAEWRALAQLVTRISANADVPAIVLTGCGETFSAGSDLNEWAGASLEEVEGSFEEMEACFQAIEQSPLPVLAALEGVAAGAGCQLALACDVVVMSESARIGMPVARLGILASEAFIVRVARRAGTAMAADLYLTGRLLTAEESRQAGLVTRLVPPGLARTEAMSLADTIASIPSSALRAAKFALGQVTSTRGVEPSRSTLPVAAPSVSFDEFDRAVRGFLSAQTHGQGAK